MTQVKQVDILLESGQKQAGPIHIEPGLLSCIFDSMLYLLKHLQHLFRRFNKTIGIDSVCTGQYKAWQDLGSQGAHRSAHGVHRACAREPGPGECVSYEGNHLLAGEFSTQVFDRFHDHRRRPESPDRPAQQQQVGRADIRQIGKVDVFLLSGIPGIDGFHCFKPDQFDIMALGGKQGFCAFCEAQGFPRLLMNNNQYIHGIISLVGLALSSRFQRSSILVLTGLCCLK